ncbi:kinase-like domain-containing protein [Glomus cerebriforme]|uniref:1-phosphatidylinositol 4-kinase n=1 Tax=Glomus cerebriforme TaxID=658196 RepID=A0A397TMK3_9GLOM|nr:kinase-like domain-containing protein [Glomus cerebriforme]
MSQQLLLRLFQSEHFNSWMAIEYLFRYPDSVGIQHYLCNELKKFPITEIEFFLPQLCHLLISRTTESVALECFILENCEKSTHMAILTLWYLQAYRSELSSNPFSPTFTVCKRVLNKCQAIVFGENLIEDDKSSLNRGMSPRQVRENTFPALVGIGAMLAGIATPMLTKSAGQIAIAQGRRARAFNNTGNNGLARRRTHTGNVRTPKQSEFPKDEKDEDSSNDQPESSATPPDLDNNQNLIDDESNKEEKPQNKTYIQELVVKAETPDIQVVLASSNENIQEIEDGQTSLFSDPSKINGQSIPDFVKGHKKSLSRSSSSSYPHRRNGINTAALTSPSLDNLHKGSLKKYVSKSSKPRPQSADCSPSNVDHDDDDDYDVISIYRNSTEVSDSTLLDELEENDPERQKRLLKGNYFHSEMQFLLALQDISTRLIIVPREARQSTLRAELTLLNHNLPAEICIPLWCPATTEKPYHHRVVRISPADAVVLNSADRVPYLLMVEVLEGEMSFDMSKLQAQKSLKRFLHDEKRKKGSANTTISSDSNKNVNNVSKNTDEQSKEQSENSGNMDNPVIEVSESGKTEQENAGKQEENDASKSTDEDKNSKAESDGERPVSPLSLSDTSNIITPIPRSLSTSSRSSKRTASIDKLPSIISAPLAPVNETGLQEFATDTVVRSTDSMLQQPKDNRVPSPVPIASNTSHISHTSHTSHTSHSSHTSHAPHAPHVPSALSAPAVFAPAASPVSPAPYTPTTPTLPESNSEYLKQVINRRQSNSADEFAERMRTAAVMLAQLNLANQVRTSSTGEPIQRTKADTEAIRQKIIKEMMCLEEERMMKMKTQGVTSGVGANGGEGGGGEMLEDEKKILIAVNKDDPSAAVFSEDWESKRERIRKASPYGHHPNWRLLSVIVKTGADLRQEQLACQLIREMQRIWQKEKVDVWVRYYRVLVTSDNSGLIETIQNSISIHSIKKDAYAKKLNEKGFMFTLFDYFVKTYGDVSSEAFLRAQDNFMRSLAAYSLVCYILQVKDRHNGNVLLDTEGHLIHIDFGFMLSNSPGSVGFELAPFKLSQEYLDILGGIASEKFAEFKMLLRQAFFALRKHADNFVLLVEMMSKDSKLPCFISGDLTAAHLKDRFQLSLTEPQFEEYLERLIMSSCCNVFTRLYDTFQYYSNGIL